MPEEQRPLLSFTTLRELFDQLYSVSAPAVVRDGTLNEDALRELFSVMQAVSDRYGLGKKANDGGIAFMVTSNASTGLGMSADVPAGRDGIQLRPGKRGAVYTQGCAGCIYVR